MAAFIIETTEKAILLSTERAMCEDWVQTLSEAAFHGNGNGGKSGKETPDSTALEMALNSIYVSREQVLEFWVTVQRTEAAERCSLRGSYILRAESDHLLLKDADTKECLYSWPYKLLRRYGRDKVMFSFEAGRRCASGPGNFTFETSQGHEIFQKVESSIRAQQGSEKRLSGPSLDTEAPADHVNQNFYLSQSEILVVAPRKDAEEKTLKGRVLPNLPAAKVAQPQHLLDPLVPGKSSTPPRSPVSHHSADSEHLAVYSEPKDSVKEAKGHFDPLYSDPVDSVCSKEVRPNKENVASPLYSDLYEQVAYEVVGGGASSEKNLRPRREEHIYDEPEGIVRTTDPPQLYSEVRMEAAAWRKHASDEKLGYEYPYNPNTDDYSVPNFQGQRSQPRGRGGLKPIPAPKPQGIILPKPPGRERDSEKVPCPVIQPNSNNNNGNIEALYSQVIKPGNTKSAKPPLSATSQLQSVPPLPQVHQAQSAPPLPQVHQSQSVPPLPQVHQSQSVPPLPQVHQSQSVPPLPQVHQSQSVPPLPQVHQAQSAPPLPQVYQSQSAPPLPQVHQAQSAPPIPPMNKPQSTPLILPMNKPQSTPPIPPMNKPQSTPPIPPMNKPQSTPPLIPPMNKPQATQPPPPPAKPQSASTPPISGNTLPLTVPEMSTTLPSLPSPGTCQTTYAQTLPGPHTSNRSDPRSVSKDISLIYEDMGFL
ncbi:PREDICTED: docking protein 1-like [Nanorana parkeri]|uniref:docking protein 1-like n=1 Tax=Nanorana parkeri TaxID=125878 RepID=UPI000854AC25|nr:PREDICTED: docking protein 1-like [Nanorana parkeri]